jgi:WD40 repeat protein
LAVVLRKGVFELCEFRTHEEAPRMVLNR